ncbi:hypothetical protein ADUPG1_001436, partial [Aduncisulcus paluster]
TAGLITLNRVMKFLLAGTLTPVSVSRRRNNYDPLANGFLDIFCPGNHVALLADRVASLRPADHEF